MYVTYCPVKLAGNCTVDAARFQVGDHGGSTARHPTAAAKVTAHIRKRKAPPGGAVVTLPDTSTAIQNFNFLFWCVLQLVKRCVTRPWNPTHTSTHTYSKHTSKAQAGVC